MKKLILCAFIFLSLPTSSFAETSSLSSDFTWKASRFEQPGWTTLEFDDAHWEYALSPFVSNCSLGKQKPSFTSPMWVLNAVERRSAYFRKVISLNEAPTSVDMTVAFDDDGDVYVNGVLVVSEHSGRTEREVLSMDIAPFLHKGENIIALKGTDTAGGCAWAQFLARISISSDLYMDVPLQKQNDEQWADEVYDHGTAQDLFCGTTIAECGCALTSLSMILNYYKIASDPVTLNEYFNSDNSCTESGCVSKGYIYGNVRWNAINAYSKEQNTLSGSSKIQFVPGEDPEYIEEDIRSGKPLIAKDAERSHWFVVDGVEDGVPRIKDPLFERTTSDIEKVRRFETVNSDFSLIEVFVKGEAMIKIDGAEVYIEEMITNPHVEEEGDVITWAYVKNPETDTYKLQVSADGDNEVIVFVADESGNERHERLASDEMVVNFDKRDVTQTRIEPVEIQACPIQEFNVREAQFMDVDMDDVRDIVLFGASM